jgi:hypothetical protein
MLLYLNIKSCSHEVAKHKSGVTCRFHLTVRTMWKGFYQDSEGKFQYSLKFVPTEFNQWMFNSYSHKVRKKPRVMHFTMVKTNLKLNTLLHHNE